MVFFYDETEFIIENERFKVASNRNRPGAGETGSANLLQLPLFTLIFPLDISGYKIHF
jgi:hypothetical protein